MYTSPPPIARVSFRSLTGTFVSLSIKAGASYGALVGAVYGLVMGTIQMPVFGTVIGIIIGLIAGPLAGMFIGTLTAIVLSAISVIWFRPIRKPRLYRIVAGSVSVIIALVLSAMLAWSLRMLEHLNHQKYEDLLIFIILPACIAAYYNWKASQELAAWYKFEWNYEVVES